MLASTFLTTLAIASNAINPISAFPLPPNPAHLQALSKRSSYLLPWLFPNSPSSVPTGSQGFTTSTSISPHSSLTSSLAVIGNGYGSLPSQSKAPDGHNSLLATYPQGSINPGNKASPHGGFSFYTHGPSAIDIGRAKEVTFGYSIWFEQGFEWQLGGKIPGLFGGVDPETAEGCSGGRQDQREECFSIRLMWRENGAGEFYNYLPQTVPQPSDYYNYPPKSVINPTYGDSIGRGAFYFQSGAWNTVTQRVRLNDVGQENGEIELWLNGQQKILISGLTIRTNPATKFSGIMAQTFFGGSSAPYASPKDQSAWFKDFSLQVVS